MGLEVLPSVRGVGAPGEWHGQARVACDRGRRRRGLQVGPGVFKIQFNSKSDPTLIRFKS
jgi:hypothetical protein